MGPLQFVKFRLAVGGRCGHIAKRTDGIDRFIWIDAVEELVIVHSPTCIIGLRNWILKCRGCTAFGQTEVTLPQSAFQQQIPSHPALLETAKTLIEPNEPGCLRCHLPVPKNENPPKNPALACAKPACHARCCRHALQSSEKRGVRRPLAPSTNSRPAHRPARKAKIITTPFAPTSVKVPDPARLGASETRIRLLTRRNQESL
jgi:hypothetical protein